MSAKPTDAAAPRHFWTGVTLVVLAIIGVTAWRSLRASPRSVAPAASPVADLEPLIPYAAPPADTARIAALTPPAPGVSRDPFVSEAPVAVAVQSGQPVEQPRAQTNAPTLNAVLITQSRRAAVINDVLVELGSRLADGTRLTAVERDHVVLTDANGVRRTLTLSDGHL
jgi:hypothetical protein